MSKFIFFILFFLEFSQEQSILDYFNKKSSDSSNEESSDCLCKIDSTSCNYLCCCDEKCGEANNYWRNRSLCIDEKDTVHIFADRCIDKHLVVKVNERRGLKKEIATEDISNSDKTITNFCFSIDNSGKMTKDIKGINFDINKISDSIDDNEENDDDNVKDHLIINIDDSEKKIFEINGSFSLFSGESCTISKEVEKFVNANYTCLMDKNTSEIIRTTIRNNSIDIKDSNNKKCTLANVYQVKDGIISKVDPTINDTETTETILEIEFIISMENYDDVSNCLINLVKTQLDLTDNPNFIFKNSVIFSRNGKIPYRYSGTNGYLNGYPLKIANNVNISNEYYIIGRDQHGNCRTDNNTYDYLYYSDKPILFNQNFSYSCNLSDNHLLEETTLFKKINNIKKIAKYGDSKIKKLNDTNYWLNVDKTGLNTNNNDNTLIKMNIYLGTKKIGIHSFKYIYKVIIKNIERNDKNKNTLSLDINYYDLDKKQEFEIIPDFPAFIPSMPGDLLDPLIYFEVDK